jgi:hypothetical protein
LNVSKHEIYTHSDGQQRNSLVHSPQRGHINSLPPHRTLRTNTRRVFTGARVHNGVNKDLNRVLVGQQVDDLERVCNDADGHELLAVVAALHHQAVDEALDDGHLGLFELLLGVTTCGVGEIDGVADLDVVGEGDVLDFDTVKTLF